jgi:hypothetical protein
MVIAIPVAHHPTSTYQMARTPRLGPDLSSTNCDEDGGRAGGREYDGGGREPG